MLDSPCYLGREESLPKPYLAEPQKDHNQQRK